METVFLGLFVFPNERLVFSLSKQYSNNYKKASEKNSYTIIYSEMSLSLYI